PTYDVDMRGIKANLPDLLAALGRSQLRRFSATQAARRLLVQRYRALLADLPGVELVPQVADDASADHLLVVLLPEGTDRDRVVLSLAAVGVTSSVHFQPVHRFAALRDALDLTGGLAVCDAMWPRALSLPLHTRLTTDDVERVVTSLADVLRPAIDSRGTTCARS
ncbi:MAG: DegT/DnrJ/EryC1/StrS aminotransferase family protein, partial [Pseudorhodobacter sp.]|nr:DegT/DnrJ/EryC1/StrS aminotransferase family protein [Frankiaceae bacterium]